MRNSEREKFVTIAVTKAGLKAMLKVVPELKEFDDNFYGERKEIPVSDVGLKGMQALADHLANEVGDKHGAAQALSFKKVLESPDKAEIARVKFAEPVIRALVSKLPKRWVYARNDDGVPQPWLVTAVSYMTPERTAPYVHVSMAAYGKGRVLGTGFSVDAESLRGGISVTNLFLKKGFFLQNPLLDAQQDAAVKKYEQWWNMTGEQFRAKGIGWGGDYNRDRLRLGAGGTGEKVVADYIEASEEEEFAELVSVGQSWGKTSREEDEDKEPFPMPLHPYIYCFNLAMHDYMWVHVNHLRPYEYQPELKSKLILPPDLIDLVDVLTADQKVLREDIVEGKAGGTTVLLQGDPGTGKTLTAEVYAEVIKRPLYKLHSGQLGTDPEQVEEKLIAALKRAERWRAAMLIDEGDVYVRARANDLEQNAIVGVFLRTLEYFNGLLFFTTNRGQDIDDAFLNRCIAIIDYPKPDAEGRRRLWEVLSKQFQVDMDAALIKKAVAQFDDVAGRDIKSYLRLSARFCDARKVPVSLEVLVKSAGFRGYKKHQAAS